MSARTQACIAVVDDHDSLSRSLNRLLRAAGMHPVSYPSAEALLSDDNRPQFDCMVIDIQLSGMSGIELNERLAASGSRSPVIFTTAYDEPEIREQAIRTGCIAYLRKTESSETILAAIARAIRPSPETGQKDTNPEL